MIEDATVITLQDNVPSTSLSASSMISSTSLSFAMAMEMM